MPVSKKQQACVTKYVKENYDRFSVTMQKGMKERIKLHAEKRGESINGFISRAVDEALERESE